MRIGWGTWIRTKVDGVRVASPGPMMSADSAPHLSPATTIALPWREPSFAAVKSIIQAPGAKPTMKPESRMLSSPPSPRPRDGSNGDFRLGRIASFAEIVEREAQGERHIRLFASPHLPVAPSQRLLHEPDMARSWVPP